MSKENKVLPTVHNNGTSARDLTEGNMLAGNAVNNALEVIRKVEFNARDYYPQGMDKWDAAVAERSIHIKALRDAAEYFQNLAIHCSDFIKEGQ